MSFGMDAKAVSVLVVGLNIDAPKRKEALALPAVFILFVILICDSWWAEAIFTIRRSYILLFCFWACEDIYTSRRSQCFYPSKR